MRLSRHLALALLLGTGVCLSSPAVALPAGAAEPALSYPLLGMYRKTMQIEKEIALHSERYGIAPEFARAVCLYESGGNANLTSRAGARGYFQVMPGTFRQLRVRTNNEAGIKYLSMMLQRFDREDLALAAYNGGPAHVRRSRPMRLETIQYVMGIAYYKNVLREFGPELRRQASRLKLIQSEEGDDWTSLSRKTGVPILLLRMYNPFLASRSIRAGRMFAYPEEPDTVPLVLRDGGTGYRTRVGDLYLTLAFIFDVAPDRIREANGLWHVDMVLPGTELMIPMELTEEAKACAVRGDASVAALAERCGFQTWEVVRDNRLWDEDLTGVDVVRVNLKPRPPAFALYKVRRGDTLSSIAGRHRISLRTLRSINGLSSSHWLIRAGDVLKIPTSS